MNTKERLQEALAAIRLLPWTVGLLWKSHRLGFSFLVVIAILQGVLPVAQLWVLKVIVDEVATLITTTHQSEMHLPRSIAYLILLEVGIAFAISWLGALYGYLFNVIKEHLNLFIQEAIYRKSLDLDIAFFEDPNYYDYLERAKLLSEGGPALFLGRTIKLVHAMVALLSVAIVVISYSVPIFILLIVSVVPSLFVGMHYGREEFQIANKRAPDERLANYYANIMTTNDHAKEVKVWGLDKFLLPSWQGLQRRFMGENLFLVGSQAISVSLTELLSLMGYYISYTIFIMHTIAGRMTIGDLTFYVGAFGRTQGIFEDAMDAISNLFTTQLFISNLKVFLDLQPSHDSQENIPLPKVSGPLELAIQDVSFKYPHSDEYALKRINLTVRTGQCIVIVGANGSGKTTLAKLLLRLYDPCTGSICLNGVDISCLGKADYRTLLSVLFQDYVRYLLSVKHNIGFGELSKLEDLEEIKKASHQANIADVIQNLSDQYETILGRYFEDGHELSIGQWQRIALARALFRNSPILILDEPTASLDPQVEEAFLNQLKHLIPDKIVIIISHRLSTVRVADSVVIIQDGEIVGEGSHEELLTKNTLYQRLYEAQSV